MKSKIKHCQKTPIKLHIHDISIQLLLSYFTVAQKEDVNKEIQGFVVIPVPRLPHKSSQQKAQAKADEWVDRSNYP